jgi:hypothetical protein
MERQVNAFIELFDRDAQLWLNMDEDQHVQQWD